MRINEILTESQQQLDEGPIGSALGAVGRGIGKVAGGLAKGVGAVAGGVVGAGRALKKGYQSGKAVVGDDPDPNAGAPGYEDPEEPETTPTKPVPKNTTPAPSPEPTPAPGPTPAPTPAPGPTPAPTPGPTPAPTPGPKTATNYAQVKAGIDQLDKKGKQRILQLLQKSLGQPATTPAPTPKPGPAPTPAPTPAPGPTPAPAPAPAPATEPAPTPAPSGEAPATKKKRAPKGKPAAGPSQAEIDADRQRLMGPTSDSKINTGNPLAEALARRVEVHKQKMFETGLARGQTSIFRK